MFLLLVVLLSTAHATDLAVEVSVECKTCIKVGAKCFNVTYLFDIIAPFRSDIVIRKMGVLRTDNFLFYSFEPEIQDSEYYKVGFVDLDNPDKHGVIGLGQTLNFNFGTFDIDQDNGLVYLGGSDGIFALDTRVNKLMPYSSRGDMISNIFFKNNVYFTRYNDRGIIVKKGDNFRTIFEYIPMKDFIVNKHDIVVFSTNFGLYVGKGDKTHRISKNAFFRGLAVDLEGNVYAWWIDGVYKVFVDKNIAHSRIEKFINLPGIGAMTFDNKNNMLIVSDKGLYIIEETVLNCTSTA